jgi:starch-binding outer membrane protein, SusD/RagB family
LINSVMTERRIEFLGEGLRNMDVMRLKGTFPAKGSVPSVDPTSAVYVWPIPSTETAANALMTPN